MTVLCLLAFSGAAEAQNRGGDMRKNYEAKLKKKFVSTVPWEQTLKKAKERARAERKPILAYFTRSYSP